MTISRAGPYRAILFDLEGTLVNFQWNLKGAVKEILAELVKIGIDPEQYGADPDYAGLFNITRRVVKKKMEPDTAEQLLNRLDLIYDAYDMDALNRWQLYPDTEDTIKKISLSGCRMGVVSNCGATAVSAVLKKYSLTSYFEFILSREDVVCIKPAPDGLIKACEHLNLPVNKILFVGDSVNDIVPARTIGMPSCFFCGGESRVTGKNQHHATFEISCLSDLMHRVLKP